MAQPFSFHKHSLQSYPVPKGYYAVLSVLYWLRQLFSCKVFTVIFFHKAAKAHAPPPIQPVLFLVSQDLLKGLMARSFQVQYLGCSPTFNLFFLLFCELPRISVGEEEVTRGWCLTPILRQHKRNQLTARNYILCGEIFIFPQHP